MDFGLFKNGWRAPEYSHFDREQYDKLKDINPGGTWNSRHQKRNFIFGMNAWAVGMNSLVIVEMPGDL